MQQVSKLFDPDTLFHRQKFLMKSTRKKNTRHLVKETDAEHYRALCGQKLVLGTPETLVDKAQTGTTRNHPKFYEAGVCRSCRQLFEKKTGRKPREDIQEYSGGENL